VNEKIQKLWEEYSKDKAINEANTTGEDCYEAGFLDALKYLKPEFDRLIEIEAIYIGLCK
jgi:hypothetical protein